MMLSTPRFSLRGLLTRIASLRITVACLLLLLILTAWGTLYQAQYGLYAAQNRFFYSWTFLNWGFVPFPGAQSVMWALFFNLTASMFVRVRFDFRNIGNILTHGGLLFLLAGTFVTHKYAVESYLPLSEGEASNVSLDRRNWEIAAWAEPGDGESKKIVAVDISPEKAGDEMDFGEIGFAISVEKYFRNCEADAGGTEGATRFLNSDGITNLVSKKPFGDPEDNLSGAILRIKSTGEPEKEMILYGGQDKPNIFTVRGKTIYISLRKKRYLLPFTVELLNVKKEDYPGTGVARSYQSNVNLQSDGGMNRNVRIYMNHPLREKDFTFYQASYSEGGDGRKSSVFAVVENGGRLIPYISSAAIFAGMLIHFLFMLFGYANRKTREESR